MRFTNIDIENFLTIGKASFSLDNKGLVLICGENRDDTSQDSNGSGKSSVVDAICWALFGVTARGTTGDEVINDRAGKNCRSAVTIDCDGDVYQIIRHRKYTKHRNRLHLIGPEGDLTLGTDKLTQELVNKLIGATVDVFCASVYAGQESMPNLPAMTDRELKSVVEEAAGIREIEAAYKEARERLNSAKKLLDDTNRSIEFTNRRLDDLQDDMSSADDTIANWNETQKAKLLSAKKSLTKAKSDKDEKEQALSVLRTAEEIDADIQGCDNKIASVQSERDELDELKKIVNGIESDIKTCKREIESGKQKLKLKKQAKEQITEKLGQPCGECGRAHDETTLGTAQRKAASDLQETAKEVKAKLSELSKLESQLVSVSQNVSDFTSTMTSVEAELTLRRELTSEKAALERQQTALNNALQDFKQKAQEWKKLRDEENPHIASKERLKSRIEETQKELDDLKVQQKEHEYAVNVAEEVSNVFSPAGVRAHILDNVTPYLNDRTAHYLTALSDGNISAYWNTLGTTSKGEIREKFNIEVSSETGGDSFKKLSGGEKRKVRLATAMALQDLVASRASKPINLFIADEVDQALDESGLERLMALMRDKAAEVGTVLVISHSDLKSWISNYVTVIKEGGQSRIEGVAL